MSKKLLLGIIVILIITNIASLTFWNSEEQPSGSEEDEGGPAINTKEPVATIGEDEITYENWMSSLRSNHGEKQLKTLIDHRVVNQMANDKGIEIDEKVIDREVSMLTAMQGVMTEEEYDKAQEGWREDIRYRYQLEMLLTEGTEIPEGDLQSHYQTYGNQYNVTPSMQLSHIVVEDEETANKVKEELDSGASFDMLAQEYSIDEETRDNGGYMGYIFTTSQFFPNGYKEKVAEMDEHSYGNPFAVGNNYAIVYLHKSLPAIDFTYDEMKPYVKSELAMHELDQTLTADPLWDELDIEWVYGE
ncbi:peptidylprolyl isomerase [Oceanobacillus manasiensis]|uniref:peptidylprolyl isomerase n=1 Tax=Oceanobacillus manasiensis TaxID=586413 RepID=UPI0005A6778F|nr:peptidyl-prolyl cis-trans isomerase [Oceanobacillus manasiensis]